MSVWSVGLVSTARALQTVSEVNTCKHIRLTLPEETKAEIGSTMWKFPKPVPPYFSAKIDNNNTSLKMKNAGQMLNRMERRDSRRKPGNFLGKQNVWSP
jgi:hypothetical protein